MSRFIYENLCCKFLSKEEASFERGSQRIVFEFDVTNSLVPMCVQNFEFVADEKDGTFEVVSFECDKFNITEIVLRSVLDNEGYKKIHIFSHIDSYKESDMASFKIGNLFRMNCYHA